jgi:hypothetical protein
VSLGNASVLIVAMTVIWYWLTRQEAFVVYLPSLARLGWICYLALGVLLGIDLWRKMPKESKESKEPRNTNQRAESIDYALAAGQPMHWSAAGVSSVSPELSLRGQIANLLMSRSKALHLILIAAAFALLNGIIFAHQGSLTGPNLPSYDFFNGLYFALYLFVLFRLIRPAGEQDLLAILAMILLLDLAYDHIPSAIALFVLVALSRWHWRTRVACLALCALAALFGSQALERWGANSYAANPFPVHNASGIESESVLASGDKSRIGDPYSIVRRNNQYFLYREIYLLPGIYMVKLMEVRPAAPGSYAEIEVALDGRKTLRVIDRANVSMPPLETGH